MPTSALDDAVLQRLQLATATAREAGKLTLSYFQRDSVAVQRKADNSPVTVADCEAEQLLRTRIATAFPNDAILGEYVGVSGRGHGTD